MNAIQQKCRPKHQVLVLKCYPRTTKGAVDVKPNSSELSYLLFYATSRRSKIQKVGQFLEKKTASDVWRVRIGNVQVTLQILAALIEKAPKDLPLFAQNVLKILDLVLRSNDITMVEASLPTFQTFCEHHDVSSLFADQAYLHQYEQVVRVYATFASTRKVAGKGTPSSKPVALKWRNAGLEAIKSIAESDTLSSVAGRQLDVIVPMVLENLWTDNEEFLDILLQRIQLEEKVDSNALARRRTSISTVKTAGTGGDANPIAISGSSGDIDKLAEEDIGVMAMQCLKQVFVIPNRAQISGATTALLRFIKERVQHKETVISQAQDDKERDHGWAIKIFEFIARWAPVQDRYIIMVTTMDALLKSPPIEENVAEQIVLTAIIASLLRSDINLIGLSVMDVLLGLIQHMRRVLRHSGGSRGSASGSASGDEKPSAVPDLSQHVSAPYRELLTRIQQSIGHLATHVYYADQISDMVSTILLRLKPHPVTANPSPPAEKADSPPGASTGNISDDQSHLDSLFSLDLGKTIALRAIKSILLVANPETKVSGNVSLTRNKVPLQVWEGTHWLLRDPDGQVRKAYVDAITTWLDRETTSADLEARDDLRQKSSRTNKQEMSPTSVARRAVSSASNREKPAKAPRSRFLLLLHLAIYDNALQFIEYDTDITLLHALLTKLVNKLGVNAVRYGLPMVFRLQEDILEAETPMSKVHLGCLCHGYFWALSEHFDFEASPVGRIIHNEIVRRRSKHFWVEGVHVPTPALDHLGMPGTSKSQVKMPTHEVESEALLPFDERLAMVERICANYRERSISPPVSPPGSPNRGFSHPILGSSMGAIPPANGERELPNKFKEEMSAEWNREAAVIALQAESKSASLSGSKTGTTATRGNHLTVNGQASIRPESAYPRSNLRPASHASHAAALRNSSVQSHGSGRSASSRGFVASVDQLKSVLSGDPVRPATFQTLKEDDDSSSDSMASYDFTPSELSFNPGVDAHDAALARSRSKSRERKASGDSGGPLTSHPTEDGEDGEEVPPVPPLPAALVGQSPSPTTSPEVLTKISSQDHAIRTPKRNIRSRGGDSLLSSSFSNAGAASMDLQAMLKGIDSKSKQNTLGNLTRPPY